MTPSQRNTVLRFLRDVENALNAAEPGAAFGEHRNPVLLTELRSLRNGRLPRVRELIEADTQPPKP